MKRILVGMSGGVDSSVSAMILQKEGHTVEGLTMYLGEHSKYATERAKEVCEKLEIKHHILDISVVFEKNIINSFKNSYYKGETPLPCAKCNREIKFGVIIDYLQSINFDYFATGHYVKMIRNIFGELEILRPEDLEKDQTHFLYGLNKDILQFILFPLANFKKTKIKEMASVLNIGLDKQPESQDICFLENKPYVSFLERDIRNEDLFKRGNILHFETKDKLGEHFGVIRYTIGQRRNIGIAYSEPLYVIKIDTKTQTIYVGEEKYLYNKEFFVKDINLLSSEFECLNIIEGVEVATRAMKRSISAKIKIEENLNRKNGRIILEEPDRAITTGQIAVFYFKNRMIGGGIIESIIS